MSPLGEAPLTQVGELKRLFTLKRKSFGTHVLRGDLSWVQTTTVATKQHFVIKLFVRSRVYLRHIRNVSFLRFYLMCRLSKTGSENKRWRTTWVPAKRAVGWGAKALAHIIFLFRAVIKQAACHFSKVNRLTFKYAVVSGAPCPQRCIFTARENWSTPPYICF